MAPMDTIGISSLLARKSAEDPNGTFASFHGARITFSTLDHQANAVAAELMLRGLVSGDRVGVMMQNCPEVLAVVFGIARAGMVWVPLNAKQRGQGLRYILEHATPSLVIADSDLVDAIADCGAQIATDRILVKGERQPYAQLAEVLGASRDFPRTSHTPGTPFAIMYTSGTTGRPKGVIVSHAMMMLAGEAAALASAIRPGDIMYVWEPLYHIGGAQLLSLPMTHQVTLSLTDRFSARGFWDQIRQCKATHIHYLGGILQILLKQPASPCDRDHPVRIAWGGGCQTEIWHQFQDRFGVELRECYGMTEGASITTINENGQPGSVGTPLPWYQVELVSDGGKIVSQSGRGEIVVRTSRPGTFFSGYWNDPEATSKVLRQGVLHTGDLGSFDLAGNLFLHGRISESVRCRGENISAWEIEHVVADHPSVEDCAIVGVAAEIGEQDIKLFVKPRSGDTIDPMELSKWLTGRLASFQLPRYIAIVDEFERTPSQRIMKHRLSRDLHDCWDRLASIPQAVT